MGYLTAIGTGLWCTVSCDSCIGIRCSDILPSLAINVDNLLLHIHDMLIRISLHFTKVRKQFAIYYYCIYFSYDIIYFTNSWEIHELPYLPKLVITYSYTYLWWNLHLFSLIMLFRVYYYLLFSKLWRKSKGLNIPAKFF